MEFQWVDYLAQSNSRKEINLLHVFASVGVVDLPRMS